MKLRWPIWLSKCDDCERTSLYWQKPWYTPFVPSDDQRLVSELWRTSLMGHKVFADTVAIPTIQYSKNALITIPRITNVSAQDET